MNINKQLLVLVMAGMVLATHTVVAADNAACTGYCGTSCGKIVSSSQNTQKYFIWALGYLSGLNTGFESGQTTNLIDTEGMKLWLQNYCDEHPLDLYMTANLNLWHELRKRQGLRLDTRVYKM